MQISKSEKKFLSPLPNPGYAPVVEYCSMVVCTYTYTYTFLNLYI